ncbi:MAG TPA: hypothetical protein VK518_21325 [Puia sp.]|nr:hypothetical protein [Puia sp.]
MSSKFVLILYYLLPLAGFGQTAVTPGYQRVESAPAVRNYYHPENNLDIWGKARFPPVNVNFPVFGQLVYREPLTWTSMIRPKEKKTGVSAAGGLVYTGSDDVFAYAHYGRTGKLIWRTSPIANNMMATRWSLASLSIFQRPASSQFQVY